MIAVAAPPRTAGVNLANPALVYSILWIGTLALTSLRLTTQLAPLNATVVALVAANIVTFVALHAAMARRGFAVESTAPRELRPLRRVTHWLLGIWAVGSAVETAIAGGLPLVWVLSGRADKDYRDFGVSTVHGLLTALYLFSLAALYLEYTFNREERNLLALGALLLWPVALVNRGVLIWGVLELSAIHLLRRRVTVRQVGVLAVAALFVVVVFGKIGDARIGARYSEHLTTFAIPEARPLFRILPSGFLWLYIYTTSPLNNVVENIHRLAPSYVPYYTVINLIPTVIRARIYTDAATRYPMPLADARFNASTWYAGFLTDMGILGAIVIVTCLQAVTMWTYRHATRGELWGMLAYAAAFEGIALSIFADTFTSLVTIAQIAIAWSFGMWMRRHPLAA